MQHNFTNIIPYFYFLRNDKFLVNSKDSLEMIRDMPCHKFYRMGQNIFKWTIYTTSVHLKILFYRLFFTNYNKLSIFLRFLYLSWQVSSSVNNPKFMFIKTYMT